MKDMFPVFLEEAVSAALAGAMERGNRAMTSIENAVAAWEGAKKPRQFEKEIRGLAEMQKIVASSQKTMNGSRGKRKDGISLLGKAASMMR